MSTTVPVPKFCKDQRNDKSRMCLCSKKFFNKTNSSGTQRTHSHKDEIQCLMNKLHNERGKARQKDYSIIQDKDTQVTNHLNCEKLETHKSILTQTYCDYGENEEHMQDQDEDILKSEIHKIVGEIRNCAERVKESCRQINDTIVERNNKTKALFYKVEGKPRYPMHSSINLSRFPNCHKQNLKTRDEVISKRRFFLEDIESNQNYNYADKNLSSTPQASSRLSEPFLKLRRPVEEAGSDSTSYALLPPHISTESLSSDLFDNFSCEGDGFFELKSIQDKIEQL